MGRRTHYGSREALENREQVALKQARQERSRNNTDLKVNFTGERETALQVICDAVREKTKETITPRLSVHPNEFYFLIAEHHRERIFRLMSEELTNGTISSYHLQSFRYTEVETILDRRSIRLLIPENPVTIAVPNTSDEDSSHVSYTTKDFGEISIPGLETHLFQKLVRLLLENEELGVIPSPERERNCLFVPPQKLLHFLSFLSNIELDEEE